MFYSALHVGSLAIDVDGNRLDAKLIRATGAIDDYFTIVKDVSNAPPSVSISSPAESASFTAPASITVTADATDNDGSIAQVDIYANNTLIGSTTSAPFSVTWNDVAAGSYALSAAATDNLGATTTSAAVNIAVNPPPPPGAPTGLAATAGDAQVSLTWNSSSGATSYNVKRSTVTGGPYATIATAIATTNFADSAVSNDDLLLRRLGSWHGGGAKSNEASATPSGPITPPAAPAGLSSANSGNAQVALSWARAAAPDYNVKRSTVSGGPTSSWPVASAATSFTDTTVINGTRYFYVVSARNAAGEGLNSAEANAMPTAPPTAPAPPTNLTATVLSKTQVNLAWSDNANDETNFLIERSTNGATFAQIASVASNITSFASTGLTANKKYYYRVRATNTVGSSAYSNVASARTLK
jgi:fibronectin type 3 domain-containing protein